MNRLKLNITNEVNQLQSVILGIANSFGSEPSLENCIDPKTAKATPSRTFLNMRLSKLTLPTIYLALQTATVKTSKTILS